ncbi:hypothetical protein WGT02_03730 [Rhizobium sp. T1470]|uniref:hypothetical protein n=1 Tax=unclassified Rhizobium TaxID=2613769 RepID=UPI001AAFED6A|nr:hypothetical protein [Rhizobium sp. T1473]MCA0800431.1 hypothetical protein [Rhizobium sp. T1473]
MLEVFRQGPQTEVSQTTEGLQFCVKAKYLSPQAADDADSMGIACAFAAVIGSGFLGYQMGELNLLVGGLFAGGVFGRPLMQMSFRESAAKTATVYFTEKAIYLERKKGQLRLDRNHRHRFVMYEHPQAVIERDKIEIAKAKGKTNWVRYYSDSFVVALEYLGQRYNIAEVMNRHDAEMIIARFNLCDEYLDDLANSRKTNPLNPQDEWHDPAGGLPH